jgi:quercetin dioxygenase-like cupin family protein
LRPRYFARRPPVREDQPMARTGDELCNPRTGHRLRFRQTAADTGGALVEVESIYEQASVAPPEHLHPSQEERFEVLEGAVRVRVDGREQTLTRGEQLTLAPGTVHTMWNPSARPARLIWQTRPALGTESFFEAFWGPAGDPEWEPPAAANALELLARFAAEFQLADPIVSRS